MEVPLHDSAGRDAAEPTTKAALRARIRTARAALAPATIADRAETLAECVVDEVAASSLLIAYLPMPGEPDLRPAMTRHLARGGAVLVPRILPGSARQLAWVAWHPGVETVPSAHAPVQEPVGEAADIGTRLRAHAEALDRAGVHAGAGAGARAGAVMLIPALAVDARGVRLGQGGGYYDRLVAGLAAGDGPSAVPVELWAVVHADEVLPAGTIPAQPHDLRTARVLTQDGIESIGA